MTWAMDTCILFYSDALHVCLENLKKILYAMVKDMSRYYYFNVLTWKGQISEPKYIYCW